jgi:hypothetical protein
MEENVRLRIMEPSKIALIQALLNGAQINVVPDQIRLNPAEKDLAESLLRIATTYGKFDEVGGGIYAAYDPGALNETQNIGVQCSNCVLYAGGDRCKIISLAVEPTGKCRFAVIPDGVVKGYGKI